MGNTGGSEVRSLDSYLFHSLTHSISDYKPTSEPRDSSDHALVVFSFYAPLSQSRYASLFSLNGLVSFTSFLSVLFICRRAKLNIGILGDVEVNFTLC